MTPSSYLPAPSTLEGSCTLDILKGDSRGTTGYKQGGRAEKGLKSESIQLIGKITVFFWPIGDTQGQGTQGLSLKQTLVTTNHNEKGKVNHMPLFCQVLP